MVGFLKVFRALKEQWALAFSLCSPDSGITPTYLSYTCYVLTPLISGVQCNWLGDSEIAIYIIFVLNVFFFKNHILL